MSNYRFSCLRSKKMLDLVKIGNTTQREHNIEIPKADSPLPADCDFGASEWAALEGIIENELSSDKHYTTADFALLQTTITQSPTNLNSDKESLILGSSENTPLPSPPQDFNFITEDQVADPASNNSSCFPPLLNTSDNQVRITSAEIPPSLASVSINVPTQNQIENSNHAITRACSPVTSLVNETNDQIQLTPVESPAPIASVSSLVTISECDSPSTDNNLRKRKSTFKTNPGKKRKRCTEKWIDNKRKLLLNTGQEYVTRKGKVKADKKLRPVCSTTCKLKCHERFNIDIRQNILTQFWQLGDHCKQWEYINKFSEKNYKKSTTTAGPSRRKCTTQYFLPLPSNDSDLTSYKTEHVCLKTFLNTLCITDQFVRTAHSKLCQEGITISDDRGKHQNHRLVLTSEMVKSVCDHVASFQPVPSHYTRQSTSKVYLDNNLSMTKMFSLYQEWDQITTYGSKALTLRQYSDIVNEHMNVGFFIPKKDICDKCHSFSNETNPTEDQINAHSKHIENKKIAREFKQIDKHVAQNSPEIVCATFDFQKILNSPHGDVGLLYYKRKLSVYNFTVFDAANKEGFCYMWTECTGKRGANEVSSCLMMFMKTLIDKGAKSFLFWSDNCSGQNRNRVVYSMYMFLARTYNVDITHRFLEKGHTQNEGDSVHALIEKQSKGKMIYTPDQWYALVRWAKTDRKPYNVIEITQQDIFDFKPLLDERNWKKDTNNNNVMWNKIKEVKVEKTVPNCLFFKYDLKGEQHCLNSIITRRRGRRMNNYDELKMAYDNILTVTDAKYKDLVSLCDTGVIPKEYHRFYKNITHSMNVAENDGVSD